MHSMLQRSLVLENKSMISRENVVTSRKCKTEMNINYTTGNERNANCNKKSEMNGYSTLPSQTLYEDASSVYNHLDFTPSPEFPLSEYYGNDSMTMPTTPTPSVASPSVTPIAITADVSTTNVSMNALYRSQCNLMANTLSECMDRLLSDMSLNNQFICNEIAQYSMDYIHFNATKEDNDEYIEILSVHEYPMNIGSYPTIKGKFNPDVYKNYAIKLNQGFDQSEFIWFTRLQPRYITAALVVNDRTALMNYLLDELKVDFDILKKYEDVKEDLSFIQNKNLKWIQYTLSGPKVFDNVSELSQTPETIPNKLTVIAENQCENTNVSVTKQKKKTIEQEQMSQLELINELNQMKVTLDNLLLKRNEYKSLSNTMDSLEKIFNDNPNYPIKSSLRDIEKLRDRKKNDAIPISVVREKNYRLAQHRDCLKQKLYQLQEEHQRLFFVRQKQEIGFTRGFHMVDDNGNDGVFMDNRKWMQLVKENREYSKRINYLKSMIQQKRQCKRSN